MDRMGQHGALPDRKKLTALPVPDRMYPPPLQDLIDLLSALPETERREMLINMAESAPLHAPAAGAVFDLEDVRKDEECTDTVGVFLTAAADGTISFNISLGPEVQTLTRAMTSILCQGLNGSPTAAILEVPADFVPKIVGAELVRLRSQTVYYVLTRMKSAAKVHQNRLRTAAQG
jgi:cysteine desulfuration protein SufE